MVPPLRLLPNIRSRGSSLAARCFTSTALLPGGRTAPFRRIPNPHSDNVVLQIPYPSSQILRSSLQNHSLFSQSQHPFSTSSRAYAISFRDLKSDGKSKESSKQEAPKSDPAATEEDPAEKAYREATRGGAEQAKRKREQQRKKESEEEAEEQASSDSKEGSQDKGEKGRRKKEEEAPPPPHGNKTPWQVFTETLKTEFQASKEWNESTKQLSASAQHFSENESVKRARAAYSAASGAATSGTAQALKGTAKAVGQGAAWTWDTVPVKGLRTGVSATGRGIEAATRPVRETKVYKTAVGGVKNVIDDGSSSRYGGWVEKEERRKQRELRELNESGASGRPGMRPEKMEEDPECVSTYNNIPLAC